MAKNQRGITRAPPPRWGTTHNHVKRVIVGQALTVIVVVASVGVAATFGVWLTWRSPAALSDEDTPWRPRIVDGVGRPAGPDAEAMGVLDRGDHRDRTATAGRRADGRPATASRSAGVAAQIGSVAPAGGATAQVPPALAPIVRSEIGHSGNCTRSPGVALC
jgi:hypothetical protein